MDGDGGYFSQVNSVRRAIAIELGATFLEKSGGVPEPGDHRASAGRLSHRGASGAGVVDSNGEVFGYPGLHIVDGSVLPGTVGPNPAFTIAACARSLRRSPAERVTAAVTPTGGRAGGGDAVVAGRASADLAWTDVPVTRA